MTDTIPIETRRLILAGMWGFVALVGLVIFALQAEHGFVNPIYIALICWCFFAMFYVSFAETFEDEYKCQYGTCNK